MRASVLAAVILTLTGPAATAAIPDRVATPGTPLLAVPAPAPAPASRDATRPCDWRIAFRPPSRLYYGCRAPDTLATSTYWIDLDPAQLGALAEFAVALAAGTAHGPVAIPPRPAAGESTLCDRFWLWAEDEGPRAPAMTRERKLAQACGPGTAAAKKQPGAGN